MTIDELMPSLNVEFANYDAPWGESDLKFGRVSFAGAYSRPVGMSGSNVVWGSKCLGSHFDVYGILEHGLDGECIAWCAFDVTERPDASVLVKTWSKDESTDLVSQILWFVTDVAKENVVDDRDREITIIPTDLVFGSRRLNLTQKKDTT